MEVFKNILLVIGCMLGLVCFIMAWEAVVNWIFNKLGL